MLLEELNGILKSKCKLGYFTFKTLYNGYSNETFTLITWHYCIDDAMHTKSFTVSNEMLTNYTDDTLDYIINQLKGALVNVIFN